MLEATIAKRSSRNSYDDILTFCGTGAVPHGRYRIAKARNNRVTQLWKRVLIAIFALVMRSVYFAPFPFNIQVL